MSAITTFFLVTQLVAPYALFSVPQAHAQSATASSDLKEEPDMMEEVVEESETQPEMSSEAAEMVEEETMPKQSTDEPEISRQTAQAEATPEEEQEEETSFFESLFPSVVSAQETEQEPKETENESGEDESTESAKPENAPESFQEEASPEALQSTESPESPESSAAEVPEQAAVLQCTEDGPAVASIQNTTLGLQENGNAVPDSRNNENVVLTQPVDLTRDEGDFLSLGKAGSIELMFENPVYNIDGADIYIYEETWGRPSYPDETITVYGKLESGDDWVELGTANNHDSGNTGMSMIDMDGELASLQYIRIVDTSPIDDNTPDTFDGFDLSYVEAACGSQEGPQQNQPPETSPVEPGNASPAGECTEDGMVWINEVAENNQGLRKDGGNIDAARSNPDSTHGANDGAFISLGMGGSITMKFPYLVKNADGADLEIYETTGGNRAGYAEETASVEVSENGIDWETAGTVSSYDAVTEIDIDGIGFDTIMYVRITDTTNPDAHADNGDGVEIDAVKGVAMSCQLPAEPDDSDEPLSGTFPAKAQTCVELGTAGTPLNGDTLGNVTITARDGNTLVQVVEEGSAPPIYGAANNQSSTTPKTTNGGLSYDNPSGKGIGLFDNGNQRTNDAILYTFTDPVTEFTLDIHDVGDFNPLRATNQSFSIMAYDSDDNEVMSSGFNFTHANQINPRLSDLYGDLYYTGDAVDAEEMQPGKYRLRVAGNDIIRVEYRATNNSGSMGERLSDTNHAFSNICYTEETREETNAEVAPTADTCVDFGSIGAGTDISDELERQGVRLTLVDPNAEARAIAPGAAPRAYSGRTSEPGMAYRNACLNKNNQFGGFGIFDANSVDAENSGQNVATRDMRFTMENGVVNRFVLGVKDYGDYQGSGSSLRAVAYDSNNNILRTVAPALDFSTNISTTGDACTAAIGEPGNYYFEINEEGIAYVDIEIVSNSSSDWGVAFTNLCMTRQPADGEGASIVGRKYHDTNTNRIFDERTDENRLNGWTINLYTEDGSQLLGSAETGDENDNVQKGQYRFEGLDAGAYLVCEEMQEGWMQTSPSAEGVTDDYLINYDNVSAVEDPNSEGQYCYRIELEEDQEQVGVRFGNVEAPLGDIRIKKLVCNEDQFNQNVNIQNIRPEEDGTIDGVAFDEVDSNTYDGCEIAEDPYYFTLHYRTERGDELIGDINEYDKQYFIEEQEVIGEYTFEDVPSTGRYWVWEVDPNTGNRVPDEQVLAMACYSSPQENNSNSLTNPMANAVISDSGESYCIVFNEGELEQEPETGTLKISKYVCSESSQLVDPATNPPSSQNSFQLGDDEYSENDLRDMIGVFSHENCQPAGTENPYEFQVSYNPDNSNGWGQNPSTQLPLPSDVTLTEGLSVGNTGEYSVLRTGANGTVVVENAPIVGRYEIYEEQDENLVAFACQRNGGYGNVINNGEYATIPGAGEMAECVVINSPEPEPETGTLEIAKYECAPTFLSNISDDDISNNVRPDANGEYDLSAIDGFDQNCVAQEGVAFGTITEEGVFASGDTPWLGRRGDEFLNNNTGTEDPFTPGGSTDANGELTISNLPSGDYGRTLVTEINGQNLQIIPEDTVIGACNNVGQTVSAGAAQNNYEVTLIPADGTSTCVYLNPQGPDQIQQLTADVKVCKEDTEGNLLSGWDMIVDGYEELVGTVDVLSQDPDNANSGITVESEELEAGTYRLVASGTYRYGNSEMIADAGYSKRDAVGNPNLRCGADADNPWVWMGEGTACNYTNGLNVRVSTDDDLENDYVTNWTTPSGREFNPEHIYEQTVTLDADGRLYFTIWDNVYRDNEGSIEVEIYKVGAEREQTTEADGCTTFEGVPYGIITLSEVMQEGWAIQFNPNGGETVDATITVDQNTSDETYTFVNIPPEEEPVIPPPEEVDPEEEEPEQQLEAALQHRTYIEQRDPVETVRNGAQYVSTSVITNNGTSPLTEVVAITAPIEGAEYVAGSWTGTDTEPEFNSPGTWQIGTLQPGESKTISYVAQIDGNQEQGLYKDLVWAKGVDQEGEEIMSEGVSSRYVNASFVGDEIRLTADAADVERERINVEQERTEEVTVNEEGEVLGASTGLPATGARTLWVILASTLIALGGGLVVFGMMLRRTQKKTPQIHPITKSFQSGNVVRTITSFLALAFITGFVLVGNAFAADLDIRLEDQQSPTGVNNFKLSFTTLDIEGRDVSIKCYKKSPSEAEFTQFGNNITLASGGGAGACQVDSSIVNQQGTYQFFAIAQAGADQAESETIAVDYNQDAGPGTPVSYNKSKSGCTYTISYKTANDDGETVRVELYRSQDTEFTVDAGTRVGSQDIGSNQDGRFEDTPGDCGKEHYYAVRAFDSNGNASGVTGDTIINVTTTTTVVTTNTTTDGGTTTTDQGGGDTGGGAIAVDNANIPAPDDDLVAGDAPGTEDTGEEGDVQGVQEGDEEEGGEENTEEEEQEEESGEETAEADNGTADGTDDGDVLGETDQSDGSTNAMVYVAIFGATVIFGVLAYFFLMRNKAQF